MQSDNITYILHLLQSIHMYKDIYERVILYRPIMTTPRQHLHVTHILWNPYAQYRTWRVWKEKVQRKD